MKNAKVSESRQLETYVEPLPGKIGKIMAKLKHTL